MVMGLVCSEECESYARGSGQEEESDKERLSHKKYDET